MNINVIGSTLPFHFLLNHRSDVPAYYIFSNNKLKKTFEILSQNSVNKKFLSFETDKLTIKNLIQSDFKIVCYHECCFSEIDNLIIKFNKKINLYPISNLTTFLKINKNLNFKDLFIFSKISLAKLFIKYIFNLLQNGFAYDYYLMPTDYGSKDDFILIKSLNHKKNKINVYENLFGFKYHKYNINKKSKKIIILISDDVIKNEIQIGVYKKIYELLKVNNFEVLVKGHPRFDKRLILKNFKQKDILDESYPFEVLNIDYVYKISLFSTSLIFEPKKSISIQNLIPTPLSLREKFKFDLRKKHLNSFKNQIKFPNDTRELLNYIKND